MAKFNAELPTEYIKAIQNLYNNCDDIFGEMTRAGAKVVQRNLQANSPLAEISSHIKLSKTYKTPTDNGINTKVYFSGYLPFRTKGRKYFSRRGVNGTVYQTNKGVPVSFLVQLYEYGRSTRRFTKKPFFRKSFNKAQIEQAMMEEQNKKFKKVGVT